MIGQRLQHYEVVAKLGEGGMGVVYKARDTHLDRFVAIKVLPPEKVADPSRKARFAQEAKAASALNHPNIVTIHDIASDSGTEFIAMEYVAGKTLDQLIPRHGMRLNEALKIAVQVADALARAHAAGIIHRDLKPANIMVDEHGQVKILDFGLAKLTEQGTSEDDFTATMGGHTGEGVIIGTPSYMSPEQAEGKPLDARSDIFSFGAVLYEMVTGRRAFATDSKVSTLSAVLHKEPAALAPEVPHDLVKIINRCLRKDPDKRFHHTMDVRVALEELKEESDSAKLTGTAVLARGERRWLPFAGIAVILALATAGWMLWHWRGSAGPAPRVVPITAYPGREQFPSLSPDGRQVAFAWDGEQQENDDIYVQLVGSGSPLRLTRDPAFERSPVWSPDSTQIAFVRIRGDDSSVHVISALGGQERKVAGFRRVPPHSNLLGPAISWAPGGKWLAVPELESEGQNAISLYPLEQGAKRRLVVDFLTTRRFYWPAFSTTGDALAFVSCMGIRSCDLYVLDLGRDFEPKGSPRRLTQQGMVIEGAAWSKDGKSIVYSAAGDLAADFLLWRVSASGGAEPERLELAGEGAYYPTLSRAGNLLAFSRHMSNIDIWKFTEGAPPTPFLSSTRSEIDPQFSPDGKRIAFATNRSGLGSELWTANEDGSNLVRLTRGTGRMIGGIHWSPDGRWIIYDGQQADGHWDIWRIDSAGGQAEAITPPVSDEVIPSWSRDGRWIYFSSNRSGRSEVWRVPAGGGESLQITREGGVEPLESWDRKCLYYRRGSRLIERVLASGAERQLLEAVPLSSYTVTSRGIYHVVRPGNIRVPGFEIRLLDPASAKDHLLHKSELYGVQGLTVSPDGKTILYIATATRNIDLMLVENFR